MANALGQKYIKDGHRAQEAMIGQTLDGFGKDENGDLVLLFNRGLIAIYIEDDDLMMNIATPELPS